MLERSQNKKNDNCLGSGTGCYLLSGGGGRRGGGEGLDDVTMKFTLFPHPKADCNILMLLLISNYWAVNFL